MKDFKVVVAFLLSSVTGGGGGGNSGCGIDRELLLLLQLLALSVKVPNIWLCRCATINSNTVYRKLSSVVTHRVILIDAFNCRFVRRFSAPLAFNSFFSLHFGLSSTIFFFLFRLLSFVAVSAILIQIYSMCSVHRSLSCDKINKFLFVIQNSHSVHNSLWSFCSVCVLSLLLFGSIFE